LAEEHLRSIDLGTLFRGRPGLTSSEGGHLAEPAAVCFAQVGYELPTPVTVNGHFRGQVIVLGPSVDSTLRRTYNDLGDAVEYGASALGIVLMEEFAGLTVYERSRKGGHGFDYFLIPVGEALERPDDNFLAVPTCTLEVSGILRGPERIEREMRRRLVRFGKKPKTVPAYAVVAEFSSRTVLVERYEPSARDPSRGDAAGG
jgi:hypothetical protein